MRHNWGKKVEKRRLREEVAARFTELCSFSFVGKVSTVPPEHIYHRDDWCCYTPEGHIRHNGVFRPWLDFSKEELEWMREIEFYLVDPKPALLVLAEQAE